MSGGMGVWTFTLKPVTTLVYALTPYRKQQDNSVRS